MFSFEKLYGFEHCCHACKFDIFLKNPRKKSIYSKGECLGLKLPTEKCAVAFGGVSYFFIFHLQTGYCYRLMLPFDRSVFMGIKC